MEFRTCDAQELAHYVLSKFTSVPGDHPAVLQELVRYFWNSLEYSSAVDFKESGAQKIIMGTGKNFVFDRKTGLIFFDVMFGTHQQLMSHFGALYNTDFTKDTTDWNHDQFVEPWDACSKLADLFLNKGHGLFQSSVGEKDTIWVSSDVEFTSIERQAFRRFQRKDPR